VRTTSFVIIPMAVYLFVLSRPMIGLFLQYKKFSQADAALTAPVLSFFALGLLAFSIFMLLQKTYYSMQDTMTPFKVSLVVVPFNIAANIFLVRLMGVKGLALGHALTYTLATVFFIYLLRRRVGALDGRSILRTLLKFAFSGALMGLAIYAAAYFLAYLDIPSFLLSVLQLSCGLLIAVAVYFAANYLLKVEELNQFIGLIWGFIRGRADEANADT